MYSIPAGQGQHTSCHEKRSSRRVGKLKKREKREKYPVCSLGRTQTSTPQRISIFMATNNYTISSKSGVHRPDCPKHSPLQTPAINSYHTPFFLLAQYSNLHSTHLFRGRPTKRLLTHFPPYTLLAILSLSILSIWPNYRITLPSFLSFTPFVTPHNSLMRAFCTPFILLIPNIRRAQRA